MKKIIYASLMLFCAACSTNTENSASDESSKTELVAAKEYACPMHCEGEKTYTKAGQCPVCKMDLQELAMTDSDSSAHDH